MEAGTHLDPDYELAIYEIAVFSIDRLTLFKLSDKVFTVVT